MLNLKRLSEESKTSTEQQKKLNEQHKKTEAQNKKDEAARKKDEAARKKKQEEDEEELRLQQKLNAHLEKASDSFEHVLNAVDGMVTVFGSVVASGITMGKFFFNSEVKLSAFTSTLADAADQLPVFGGLLGGHCCKRRHRIKTACPFCR